MRGVGAFGLFAGLAAAAFMPPLMLPVRMDDAVLLLGLNAAGHRTRRRSGGGRAHKAWRRRRSAGRGLQ